MRTFLCFFIVLCLSSCQIIQDNPSLDNSEMVVTVLYPDQTSVEFTLPLYSIIADLLERVDCGNCDFSRLNPQAALHPKDVIVLYEKQASCVSINQASLTELDTLKGIGPSLAQKIIDYRQTMGYFQSLDELMLIKGIKEKLFSKIEAFICL